MNRRELITGISALVCAPAVVRASSLMPVRAYRPLTMIISPWGYYSTRAHVWPGSPDGLYGCPQATRDEMQAMPAIRRFASARDAMQSAGTADDVVITEMRWPVGPGGSLKIAGGAHQRLAVSRCYISSLETGDPVPMALHEVEVMLARLETQPHLRLPEPAWNEDRP